MRILIGILIGIGLSNLSNDYVLLTKKQYKKLKESTKEKE